MVQGSSSNDEGFRNNAVNDDVNKHHYNSNDDTTSTGSGPGYGPGSWFLNPFSACCSTSFDFLERQHDDDDDDGDDEEKGSNSVKNATTTTKLISDSNNRRKKKDYFAFLSDHASYFYNSTNNNNNNNHQHHYGRENIPKSTENNNKRRKQDMMNDCFYDDLPVVDATPITALHRHEEASGETKKKKKLRQGDGNVVAVATLATATAVGWLPHDSNVDSNEYNRKKNKNSYDDSDHGQDEKKVPEHEKATTRQTGPNVSLTTTGASVVAPVVPTQQQRQRQQQQQHLRPAWISLRYCVPSSGTHTGLSAPPDPVLPWSIELRDILFGNDRNDDSSMEIASMRVDALAGSVWKKHADGNATKKNDVDVDESASSNVPFHVGDKLTQVDDVLFLENWTKSRFDNYMKEKFQKAARGTDRNRNGKKEKGGTNVSSSPTWLNLVFYNPKGNPDIKQSYIVYNDESELLENHCNDDKNVDNNNNNDNHRNSNNNNNNNNNIAHTIRDDRRRRFTVKDWMVMRGTLQNNNKSSSSSSSSSYGMKSIRTTKTLREVESSLGLSVPFSKSKFHNHRRHADDDDDDEHDVNSAANAPATLKRIDCIDPNGWLGDRSVIHPGDYLHSIHHLEEGSQSRKERRRNGRQGVIRVTVANGSNTIYLSSLRGIRDMNVNEGSYGDDDKNNNTSNSYVRLQEDNLQHSPLRRRRPGPPPPRHERQGRRQQGTEQAQQQQQHGDRSTSAVPARSATRDAVVATEVTPAAAARGTAVVASATPSTSYDSLSPFVPSRSLTPPPPPPSGNSGTALTATSSDNVSRNNGNNIYRYNPTTTTTTTTAFALPKPKLVSISFIKPTRETKLGMKFIQQKHKTAAEATTFQDSLLVVNRIDPDGLLAKVTMSSNSNNNNNAHDATPNDNNIEQQSYGFRAGCRLISINRRSCSNWTPGQAAGYIKSLAGRITLVGEYVDDGNESDDQGRRRNFVAAKDSTAECVVQKRNQAQSIGVSFRRINGMLTIVSVGSKPKPKTTSSQGHDDDGNGALFGLCSILQPGHEVLAVNGIATYTCDPTGEVRTNTMSAREAVKIVTSAKSAVTILTQPRRGHYHHAIVTALIQ